ncbi:tetratricopeptide repeat protein [Aquimarina rhabdastrellae]
MKKSSLFFYILFIALFTHCGVPQADYDQLKTENEKLKQEIANCNLTPKQLLEQATSYFDALEYDNSKERLSFLIDKYPNTREAKQAKSFLKKVEKEAFEATEKEITTEDHNKKYAEALTKMRKRYDIDKKITWYYDKTSPKFNNENGFYAYLGKKEKHKPWLGFAINHFSKKWLFIERIEITADGKSFIIEEEKPGEFKANEENDGNREWIDRIIKKDQMELFNTIAKSKSAKLKFIGKNASTTKTITTAQKKAFANILELYKMMGGSM